MKNNFKKPISVLLSMLIAAASSTVALSAATENVAGAATEPTVYTNTYDESYVADYYAINQTDEKGNPVEFTKDSKYSLVTETDGNVCAYYADYDPNHWYRRAIAIYNPEKAAEQALTNFTNENARIAASLRYDGIDPSKTTRTFKVSLRYRASYVRKDVGDGNIYMGLRLAHLNSSVGNTWDPTVEEIGRTSQVQFFTIDSEVSNWTNIEAYVTFTVNSLDWQYGLALYLDGAGDVYLDDITVTDYTDTNALFANLTVDGTAIGTKVLSSATDLPKYVDQKIVQGGWYTDAEMTLPFDFDSYDLSAGRNINLYAATAGVVYENSYEEEYVSYFYGTDDQIYDYNATNDIGYKYLIDSATGNGYIKYFETDGNHSNDRPLTIYDPANALKHYNMQGQYTDKALRMSSALRYQDAGPDTVRLYKVSFRYNCTWLNAGNEIYVGLKMTHLDSYVQNNVNNCFNTATKFFTISNQTSWGDTTTGWNDVEAYVLFTVPSAFRNWQFGLSLYLNGQGTVLLDDLKVEDYTDTNYSLVNTYIDSSEPTKQAIMPISCLNPLEEGYRWYTGADLATEYTDFIDRTSGSADKLSVDIYGVPFSAGDANGDNVVNAQDLVILKQRLLSDGNYIHSIDLNNNGVLDIVDIVILKKNIPA